jgi:hypothetical protein
MFLFFPNPVPGMSTFESGVSRLSLAWRHSSYLLLFYSDTSLYARPGRSSLLPTHFSNLYSHRIPFFQCSPVQPHRISFLSSPSLIPRPTSPLPRFLNAKLLPLLIQSFLGNWKLRRVRHAAGFVAQTPTNLGISILKFCLVF